MYTVRLHALFHLLAGVWLPCCMMSSSSLSAIHAASHVDHKEKELHGFIAKLRRSEGSQSRSSCPYKINFFLVNMACSIVRGCVRTTTTTTESHKMAAIILLIGCSGLMHIVLMFDIHVMVI